MSAVLPPSVRSSFWPSGLTLQGVWFALAVGVVAMTARAAMQPILGSSIPFVLAFPAVTYVALRHGAAAGLLTTVLCAVWAAVPFLPPTIAVDRMPIEIGTFAAAAIFISLICARFHTDEELPAAAAAGADSALTRWLRGVLWGAALLPLTAFVAASWWGYQDASDKALLAGRNAAQVGLRHAESSFQSALEAIERARALTAMADSENRTREADLHARFKDLGLSLPPGSALSVIDAQGRLLVTGAAYPTNPATDYRDREYFDQLKRQPNLPVFVSGVITGRQSGQLIFTVARARLTADGKFDGVITAAMQPAYFQAFYKTLAPEGTQNTFVLFRNDGVVLTRWPPPPRETPQLSAASPVLPMLRSGEASGQMWITSTFDGVRRLVSFQRVADLPVYVVAGLDENYIRANWLHTLSLLAAILLPTTLVLVYVAWLALQRVRRHQALSLQFEAELQRRAQAEVALAHTQKLEALGHLTGGVAHDFNNLLAVISNNVYLLKRLFPDSGAAGPVAAISRATASGVKLTQQLLSLARKRGLKPQTLILQEWLPAAAELLRTTVGSRVDVQLDVDPATAPIVVDPVELEIALINLAVNAKNAMPEGGSLRLSAANGNGVDAAAGKPPVVVSVTDTGSGIAPELLQRVFEPFFTTKGPGMGTGLGLSQVHGLCVESGGSISIDRAPGRGTTVSMSFPAQVATLPAETATPARPTTRLSGHMLLVEDNDELANAQAALLRSMGLIVERVRQCDEGAELAEREHAPYQVLLADIVTPGTLDGVDMALRLRQNRPGLPVILMTGYSSRVGEATAAGIVVFNKPVDPSALLAELVRVLAPAQTA